MDTNRGLRLPVTLKNLFKPRIKQGNVHRRYPVDYFKHVYLTKKVFTGIELIASIEGISHKALVDKFLTAEISRYIAAILLLHVQNQRINRLRGKGVEPIPTLPAIKKIRKYIKQNDGMSEYLMKKYGL